MTDPHSRACGIVPHDHGPQCHPNCPTCSSRKEVVIDNETVKRCWCGGGLVYRYDPKTVICIESPLHDPLADGRPKDVRRLYVAGPMSGYPECNYPAFNRAEHQLVLAGFQVVNPAGVHIDTQHHYVDLLRADLLEMLTCHGVATLDNWWESVGARNEVQVAGTLKMPVRPLAEWLSIGYPGGNLDDTPKEKP